MKLKKKCKTLRFTALREEMIHEPKKKKWELRPPRAPSIITKGYISLWSNLRAPLWQATTTTWWEWGRGLISEWMRVRVRVTRWEVAERKWEWEWERWLEVWGTEKIEGGSMRACRVGLWGRVGLNVKVETRDIESEVGRWGVRE